MTEATIAMTEATTHTLEVPGAELTYDVRTGRVQRRTRSSC